ncbi:response regulator, partial [Brevundimonas sp.]|uniref:response regulator n=1 Tax=Brevundimonas sp. TaxID=1871086 RepID=UPI002AB83620
ALARALAVEPRLILLDEALSALDATLRERLAGDLREILHAAGTTALLVTHDHDEAFALAMEDRPGLVLADIQLADDSSGIDAVKDILKRIDVPVIFITAFPERLLTGERPEPTFLITKPFQPETVKAAISQALFFHPTRQKQAA